MQNESMPCTPLPVPEPSRRRLSAAEASLLVASMALPWLLAGAMPLLPPDEGRYASVAARMVETGNWIIPEFEGQPHLTKPPLTYWLQAAALKAFGHGEWAVRFPSVAASCVTVLLTFLLGRRLFGTRPGLIAAAMLPLMPLVAVVGRLASTDALLSLCWLASLGLGWLAIEDGRRRHAIGFWIFTGIGLIVKSVAAFGPLAILVAWAVLGRRAGDVRRLRPLPWAALTALPLLAWLALVHRSEPQVLAIAWQQTFGRVVGAEGIWPKPWWYYAPVYIVGFFPATAMLTLPWINQPLRASLATFRSGDARSLCLVAVAVPLVGFSLSSGKMPTYLLPLAAPSALLASLTLERWLRSQFSRPIEGFRPPDVRITIATIAIIVGAGGLGAAIWARPQAPTLWVDSLPLLVTPILAILVALAWNRVDRRDFALLGLWIAGVSALAMMSALLARHAGPMGARGMLAELTERIGRDQPTIALIGLEESCIPFYNGGQPTIQVHSLAEMVAAAPPAGTILLTPDEPAEQNALGWAAIANRDPKIAGDFQPLGRWTRWFGKPTRILIWNPPGVGGGTRTVSP